MNREIKFDLFQVEVDSYEDSEFTTFEEMLTNPPVTPIVLARNGNKFDLYNNIRKRGELYVGTFCLVQMNEIPPKARLGENPEELDLDDDTGLGHYTSFIFDPTNNIIVIQSNRQGVSANGVADYFRRNYRVRDIKFNLIIDPADIARLQGMHDIRHFDVTVARVENGEIFERKNQSFSQLFTATDGSNADLMKVHISAGYKRESSLSRTWIARIVRSLVQYADSGEVKKIEVRGREENEDAIHVIDFLENKVKISITLPRSRSVSDFYIRSIIRAAVREYTTIKPELDRAYKVKKRI